MSLSVVIPALNEQFALPLLLADLQPLRARGVQIIVVDGGSSDATAGIAQPLADIVLSSPPGRSRQLNAGAAVARGDVLLFVHADCRLPADSVARIASLRAGSRWGFFRTALRGESGLLGVVSWFMWQRSRLTGIATGDQGLFVERGLFDAAGGYPDQPLMEDVEICARLKRFARPQALPLLIDSSGRRWDSHGAWRTIALMWSLRLRYFLGTDPARLHRDYYGPR